MAFPAALSNLADTTDEIIAAHINNLEAKVGITDSAVTSSIDYKLGKVATGQRAVNVGDIKMTGCAAAPAGWLLCQGQAVSRTVTYAALFAAIGTAFGVGNGSTTFNLPDLQDNFPIGKSGTKALGSTGGAATIDLAHTHTGPSHTHTGPSHSHSFSDTSSSAGAHNHGSATGNIVNPNTVGSGGTSQYSGDHQHSIGSDGAHTHSVSGTTGAGGTGATGASGTGATSSSLSATQSVLNPYQAVNFVIKY